MFPSSLVWAALKDWDLSVIQLHQQHRALEKSIYRHFSPLVSSKKLHNSSRNNHSPALTFRFPIPTTRTKPVLSFLHCEDTFLVSLTQKRSRSKSSNTAGIPAASHRGWDLGPTVPRGSSFTCIRRIEAEHPWVSSDPALLNFMKPTGSKRSKPKMKQKAPSAECAAQGTFAPFGLKSTQQIPAL